MSQMLTQAFGVIETAFVAITRAPSFDLIQVFVNAMVSAQPFSLRLIGDSAFPACFQAVPQYLHKSGVGHGFPLRRYRRGDPNSTTQASILSRSRAQSGAFYRAASTARSMRSAQAAMFPSWSTM